MIVLRAAQFSDYRAISKLHAESWRQNYRGIYSDHFLDNEVEQDRLNVWQQRLKSPSSNQYVTIATLDGAISGFACLYLNNDPIFGSLLDNLHVSPDQKRSGVGRLLMKECAKYICNNASSTKMYLWVFESNKNARNFYERLGGKNFETITKQNNDGTFSRSCRYIWDDVSMII